MNTAALFKSFSTALWSILLTLSLYACQSDSGLTVKKLIGEWTCVEGQLNGKPHDASKGFFFKFTENTVTSNMFPELELPETLEGYILKDNRIELPPSAGETAFSVDELLADGRLKLGLKTRGMQFQFTLEKK